LFRFSIARHDVRSSLLAVVLLVFTIPFLAQEEHHHPAPEQLGSVVFPTSCTKAVQPQFERAVALLHSFAYADAEKSFRQVIAADPKCAIAHWGVAMSFYHQLWEPWITPAHLTQGAAELEQAHNLKASPREHQFIDALETYYGDSDKSSPQARAAKYQAAMKQVAQANPKDVEAQVFYALALIANASPMDQTYAAQKEAAAILQPLYKSYPDHPGIPHYLIHAYDNSKLAARGLPAAREYSKIAPSAPHALHMPSHIFTRLGYWDDSIQSNLAARAAAHQQGDVGEELHAMDYLTYAYLQRGQSAKALSVLDDLRAKPELKAGDFKVGYAATAMRVRFAIETRDWEQARNIQAFEGASPQVTAIAYWSRAIGSARSANPSAAEAELAKLSDCEARLKASGNEYWRTQTHVLLLESQAWIAQARGDSDEAVSLLRSAANTEDSVEKLPVTPGPIVPAREQLGELLLMLNHPQQALQEYEVSLTNAPGRRGALRGAADASENIGDLKKARAYRAALQ
jgi:hypothetical protein